MSLATRCTSCGTVFRVVQDQLKVSEGWVRCGRCDDVFNALEGLFDLERDAPPDWSPVAGPEAVHAVPSPEVRVASLAHGSGQPTSVAGKPIDTGLAHSHGVESPFGARETIDTFGAEETFDTTVLAADSHASAPHSMPGIEDSASSTPDFLRHAQRQSRWRGSRARLGMVAATILLLVGLAGQIAHHFRDLLWARWPIVGPTLTAWCDAVGCTIEPVRRIEDIAVESTALTRAAEPDSFRLVVALRNRGTMVLALPSLELSLTDSSGQLVARRTLEPQDFRGASPTLSPSADSALQLTLATGNSRVTGYTVEIFYP